ncbi:MAG TPA: NUDIX hydrolase [Acidimicrobiales bacterium]|nr:NUDIX hydrolase [Acidimicrobiales bacterium]
MTEPVPEPSSFRRLSEVEVFRGWLFTVGHVDLIDPDGQPFDRFVIHHPGAVTIVAVDDNRRVTLVRQYRSSVDRMMLEAPAGTRDVAGEPAEETARRELAEEAGLEAESMEVLMGTFNTPGISDQYTTIFLATGLSPVPTRPAGVEEGFMTVETIGLDEIEALVADGTLLDETTVLGLLLARARLDGARSP